MKTLFFVFFIAAFASCGNNSGVGANSDSSSVQFDSSSSGTLNTDTTGMGGMNADTTGMGAAR